MSRDRIGHAIGAALLALVLLAHPHALAQTAPADGLYEELPSFSMVPVGLLAAPPTDRPWVELRTTGHETTATFQPDGRVVWRITWGTNGPVEKLTEVDGVLWTRSLFTYDANGHLATKVVTGPGAPTTLVYAYRTDATGVVLERTATIHPVALPPILELVAVTRSARRVEIVTRHDGLEVRRDVRDEATGLLLETHFSRAGAEVGRLTYQRRPDGSLRVMRRMRERHGVADATHPDPLVSTEDLFELASLALDRREAWLLLGAPTRATDGGQGVSREMHDDWAGEACWLNSTSGIEFDATGLARTRSTACICGFCVDAAAAFDDVEEDELLATDLHWTRGPWIRLDETVDVTADHRVMTPRGPIPAGELHVGDVVLASDGTAHVLGSVEHLPLGELRLGRNLRTTDGTFGAGGLLFESEAPRACD